MSDRTAIDAIRGYFYQFDFTIESLLKLSNNNDSIIVEGIEDVDIYTSTESKAIQCKYYEKTEYNHSIIAEPLRWMLSHFKEVKEGHKSEIKYKLRGFYNSGQSKLKLPITIQYLKDNFLTYSRSEMVGSIKKKVKHFHHLELNLNDYDLNKFASLLEIDIHAKEFDQQYKDIISQLRSIFNCKEYEAENFYYNNALRLIRDLSKDSNVQNRTISKQEFLIKINTRNILFNEWFLQRKGVKAHLASLRNEYFGNLNILFKERFFLFEINPSSFNRSEIKDLIYLLIKKYTKIDKQPTPFCPYIYFHGLKFYELVEIKNDLISDDIILIDGFDFEGSSFNAKSLLNKPNSSNRISIKFINSIEHLPLILSLTERKSEIYQFYLNESFFSHGNSSIKEVKIQIKDFNNIKNII